MSNLWRTGVALLICSWTFAAQACPTCGKALQSQGGNVVAGFQCSILFMMSMPFLLRGFFSLYMYIEVRRARARQEAEKNTTSHSAEKTPSLSQQS